MPGPGGRGGGPGNRAVYRPAELRRQAWFLPAMCGTVTPVLGLVFLLARGAVDSNGFLGVSSAGFGCAARVCCGFRSGAGQREDAGRRLRRSHAGVGAVSDGWFGFGPGAVPLPVCLYGERGRRGFRWRLCAGWRWTCPGLPRCPVTPVLCAGLLSSSQLMRRSRVLPLLCPALWSLPAMYVAREL